MTVVKENPHAVEIGRRIAALRKHRGYKSAHEFFNSRGGVARFGISYQQFLLVEKGERMPSRTALRAILGALGSGSTFAREREELLVFYVKALLCDGKVFSRFIAKLDGRAAEKKPLFDQWKNDVAFMAARKAVTSVPRLEKSQAEAVSESPVTYWIHRYLIASGMRKSAESLSQALGFERESVEGSLETLVRLALVDRGKAGYIARHAATDIFTPQGFYSHERAGWLWDQYGKRTLASRHPSHFQGYCLALDDALKAADIVALGRRFTNSAYLYRSKDPVKKGTFVGVECMIVSVARFGK